jgi:hypothetical protein
MGGPVKREEFQRDYSMSSLRSIKQIACAFGTDGVVESLEVARVPLVSVTRRMHTQPPFSFPIHCTLSRPRCFRSRGR